MIKVLHYYVILLCYHDRVYHRCFLKNIFLSLPCFLHDSLLESWKNIRTHIVNEGQCLRSTLGPQFTQCSCGTCCHLPPWRTLAFCQVVRSPIPHLRLLAPSASFCFAASSPGLTHQVLEMLCPQPFVNSFRELVPALYSFPFWKGSRHKAFLEMWHPVSY